VEDKFAEVLIIRHQDPVLSLCTGKQYFIRLPGKGFCSIRNVMTGSAQPADQVGMDVLVGQETQESDTLR
jgi:hypothetical protein